MAAQTQQQVNLRALFENGVKEGMSLLEDALRELGEVDDDVVKMGVDHAKDKYKQEGDHLFQQQLDSGRYN